MQTMKISLDAIPTQNRIHLLYIDANNLYGNLISSDNRLTVTLLNYSIYTLCIIQTFLKFKLYLSGLAMSQYLPTYGFRWLNQDEIDTISTRIQNLKNQDEYGYIFEVDLQYPHHLHHTHSDYPLAPEHLEMTSDMLSPFQQSTYPKHKLRKTKKLTPNLMNKHKYIVHYHNLKYY